QTEDLVQNFAADPLLFHRAQRNGAVPDQVVNHALDLGARAEILQRCEPLQIDFVEEFAVQRRLQVLIGLEAGSAIRRRQRRGCKCKRHSYSAPAVLPKSDHPPRRDTGTAWCPFLACVAPIVSPAHFWIAEAKS